MSDASSIPSHSIPSYSIPSRAFNPVQLFTDSGVAMEGWMLALKQAASIAAAVPSGNPITPGTDDTGVPVDDARPPRRSQAQQLDTKPSKPGRPTIVHALAVRACLSCRRHTRQGSDSDG